jgi:hypothetical protein
MNLLNKPLTRNIREERDTLRNINESLVSVFRNNLSDEIRQQLLDDKLSGCSDEILNKLILELNA